RRNSCRSRSLSRRSPGRRRAPVRRSADARGSVRGRRVRSPPRPRSWRNRRRRTAANEVGPGRPSRFGRVGEGGYLAWSFQLRVIGELQASSCKLRDGAHGGTAYTFLQLAACSLQLAACSLQLSDDSVQLADVGLQHAATSSATLGYPLKEPRQAV